MPWNANTDSMKSPVMTVTRKGHVVPSALPERDQGIRWTGRPGEIRDPPQERSAGLPVRVAQTAVRESPSDSPEAGKLAGSSLFLKASTSRGRIL